MGWHPTEGGRGGGPGPDTPGSPCNAPPAHLPHLDATQVAQGAAAIEPLVLGKPARPRGRRVRVGGGWGGGAAAARTNPARSLPPTSLSQLSVPPRLPPTHLFSLYRPSWRHPNTPAREARQRWQGGAGQGQHQAWWPGTRSRQRSRRSGHWQAAWCWHPSASAHSPSVTAYPTSGSPTCSSQISNHVEGRGGHGGDSSSGRSRPARAAASGRPRRVLGQPCPAPCPRCAHHAASVEISKGPAGRFVKLAPGRIQQEVPARAGGGVGCAATLSA